MPELPEVHTIVTDLQILTGDRITSFWSDFKKAIKTKGTEKEIIGKKILGVKRLGKIILIALDNEKSLGIHLKMTGKLLLIKQETWNMEHESNKHFHHAFFLKKNGVLAFSDVRKFATISLLNKDAVAEIKNNYGIDPIDGDFSISELETLLKKRKNKPVKSILMDNSVILGIGNIYASEILFEARVLPMRLGGSLNKNEIIALHRSILKILKKAIKMRGTSVSDYRDSAGKKGSFQNELKVYKKHGQKCKSCDTMVEKVIIGQRSTFFCPKCQK